MNKENINYGFIDKIRPSDHILGANSNEIRTVLFDDGDCTKYIPKWESQLGLYGDTFACCTYSSANCVETSLKGMADKDLLLKQILKELDLYDENKDINSSDRIIAKYSGTFYKDTDPYRGNYFTKVAEAWRKIGILADNKYPFPFRQRTPVFSIDEYYKDLTDELINESKKSLIYFKINYILISVNEINFREQLKYGPIQVSYNTSSPIVNGVYQNSSVYKKPNHAVMLYNKRKEDGICEVLDNYERDGQGHTKFASDYKFGMYGLQYYITSKINNNTYMSIKDGQMYLLVEGNEQKLGMGLNDSLIIYKEKVDTILNSAGRLGKFKAPTSVGLEDWNSVKHLNGKLEPLDK